MTRQTAIVDLARTLAEADSATLIGALRHSRWLGEGGESGVAGLLRRHYCADGRAGIQWGL